MVIEPKEPGKSVKRRQDEAHDDPALILVDDEVPMDWYNVEMRQFQYDLARGVNFGTPYCIEMFNHFNVQHVDWGNYLHVFIWEEKINTRGSGARGNDDGDDDDEDKD